MNERIRKLAKESRLSISQAYSAEFNKFAQLIVAECLDVVAMRIYLGPEEICRQECKALASEIKEHFGVE